ncbi:MAG: FAD-dependent oxidoreductase [Xanthobacteraceae bacterium]|uniref:FAD-dependent oxidoreductase n=1 Tax=Pseudolabrys sp. TaxID=1960880 RepID=UPI003D1269F9
MIAQADAGEITTTCCIAGGGPAGMMLGVLLARAGIDVVVLEKHKDFLRDFRGDTIHPSTLELMHELGLLEDFLKLPHQKVRELVGQIGGSSVTIADFGHVPTRCKFIALMPQWDFLDFLADYGKTFRGFELRMRAEAVGLIEHGGRVAGVRVKTPDGDLAIRAQLVIGADGRHSTLRKAAGLQVEDFGVPIDVLWFRVSRRDSDPDMTFGHVEAGCMMVMLNRGDYWQCAYIIRKGGIGAVKEAGLPAFRDAVAALSPFLSARIGEITDWDEVKLLSVSVDRLTRWWKPGLLCIGDAAHAMSPIGGVGINLAIQDAVAAANELAGPLAAGTLATEHLHAIEQRRLLPVRVIQRIQIVIQNRIISGILKSRKRPTPPWPLKLLNWFPVLRRLPAYLVGVGIRTEHIRTPEAR